MLVNKIVTIKLTQG